MEAGLEGSAEAVGGSEASTPATRGTIAAHASHSIMAVSFDRPRDGAIISNMTQEGADRESSSAVCLIINTCLHGLLYANKTSRDAHTQHSTVSTHVSTSRCFAQTVWAPRGYLRCVWVVCVCVVTGVDGGCNTGARIGAGPPRQIRGRASVCK